MITINEALSDLCNECALCITYAFGELPSHSDREALIAHIQQKVEELKSFNALLAAEAFLETLSTDRKSGPIVRT